MSVLQKIIYGTAFWYGARLVINSEWPELAMPSTGKCTSGWASPRTIDGKTGIHGALDFANKVDDPVRAVADGVVVKAETGSGETGKYVLLKHTFWNGLTLLSRNIHLNSYKVKEGQEVKKGEVIAGAGNSGVGGAIHLHFDLHVCGEKWLNRYRARFGWPSTTGRPLIKKTLPDCYLIPSEPLVPVSGYRDTVIAQAEKYNIKLLG